MTGGPYGTPLARYSTVKIQTVIALSGAPEGPPSTRAASVKPRAVADLRSCAHVARKAVHTRKRRRSMIVRRRYHANSGRCRRVRLSSESRHQLPVRCRAILARSRGTWRSAGDRTGPNAEKEVLRVAGRRVCRAMTHVRRTAAGSGCRDARWHGLGAAQRFSHKVAMRADNDGRRAKPGRVRVEPPVPCPALMRVTGMVEDRARGRRRRRKSAPRGTDR